MKLEFIIISLKTLTGVVIIVSTLCVFNLQSLRNKAFFTL